MDQMLLFWIGTIVIILLGTLAHFLYDLAGQPRLLGLFTAVNESTWEHVKIAITPTLLWSLVDGYLYGENPNYFTAKLASLCVLSIFISLVFYSYRRFAKHSILPIDISIFIVAIILAELSFFGIVNLPAFPFIAGYLSAIGTFIFFGAYMTLTLAPIKNMIFKDPTNGQYGFRAHRDFFKRHKNEND